MLSLPNVGHTASIFLLSVIILLRRCYLSFSFTAFPINSFLYIPALNISLSYFFHGILASIQRRRFANRGMFSRPVHFKNRFILLFAFVMLFTFNNNLIEILCEFPFERRIVINSRRIYLKCSVWFICAGFAYA